MLWSYQIKALEEWTILSCDEIIFDSDVDNQRTYSSVFVKKLLKRSQYCIVIENEDGNIFGYHQDINIFKENYKSESCCYQNENSHFDYKQIYKALIDKPKYYTISPETFTLKRIIVIQMK